MTRSWEWTVDRMDRVAEALHDGWWKYQIEMAPEHAQKKQLGPRPTADDKGNGPKCHPHLVPWSAKDEAGRNQDRFQAAILLARHAGRWHDVTPDEIHDAWSLWVDIHHGCHPHNKPFAEAHRHGADEHVGQAERVNRLFREWRGCGPER